MSGTLTITYTEVPGGQTVVSRSQVGGTGEPDLTITLNYATIGGHLAVSQTLTGGLGDDVLVADPITYLLDGGGGNDTLSGEAGHFIGGAGADWLRGNAGENVLTGGLGSDTIDGGAGFDLAAYGNADHGVTVDLRIAGPQETGEGVDVLTSIEGVFDVGFGGVYADTFIGDAQSNWLRGGGGDDLIYGLGGDDTITDGGYDGWDGYEPMGATTQDHLHGGDGNDQISGGADSDDLNGNQGNDTVHGDAGDDWVVGGKDGDLLFGDEGSDIVLGNLGDDTLDGGEGADVARGGQGDDSLAGGASDDWLSGDLGSDTLAGGAGADLFHTFGETGIDRVTDFNQAEGDRVHPDPGTTYTVSQSGADTVITMGGGQMILVGVSMASLTGDWIVGA